MPNFFKEYVKHAQGIDWEQMAGGEALMRQRLEAYYSVIVAIWGPERVLSRASKMGVLDLVDSRKLTDRVWALQKLVIGDHMFEEPAPEQIGEILDMIDQKIADMVARRSVEDRLERMVHERMHERHEEYMQELRRSVMREEAGPETASSQRKMLELEALEQRSTPLVAGEQMRPKALEDVVGQAQAILAVMSKLSTPYPQHILLYGPPGVGKTTVARLVMEYAKTLPNSAFGKDAPFIEVDGTILRWDPREVTNPLIGSVHDPIYQGARRDLADGGLPEPKPGLVTDAHGGILFIDEIGEMDWQLQVKLLKVLEDKRVQFDSAYYDPESPNIPQYIRKLFDEGAPANFVLIGATTRLPESINPAIRSRCAEVFFDPMNHEDIANVVKGAAKRLRLSLDKGVADLIADHADDARKAISILSDAHGLLLFRSEGKIDKRRMLKLSMDVVREALQMGRQVPLNMVKAETEPRIGRVYGLGAHGFLGSTLEIEAAVFPALEPGKGSIRFNSTAGSMAKDSVEVAAAVIRRIYNLRLTDYDVNLNVVGGANVDGPSAGAALTLAIASAIKGIPVRQDVALTGEISLQGYIKPVGGLYGKAYGARQAGMKEILIPQENANELSSESVGIQLIPVATIDDVLQHMLVEQVPQEQALAKTMRRKKA